MEDYKSWLPQVDDSFHLDLPHFPTRWQAVLFRLWEYTPVDKLAALLGTDADTVRREASAMRLPPQGDTKTWRERGYITSLRSIWALLPYEQILQLLDVTREELSYILKEDDFLSHKFGNAKFPCAPVKYAPLTSDEAAATMELAAAMEQYIRKYDAEDVRKPFDFFASKPERRAAGNAPENCAVLDDSWVITDLTGNASCADYAADFCEDFEAVWNVRLASGKADAKVIRLVLDSAFASEPEEYHVLDIAPDCITLSAGYPMGITRGLYYLETLAEASGGPYIPCGIRRRRPAFDARYIYSYCGLYGAPLDVDTRISFPDELLRSYARVGANGVWLQGVLYTLIRFPFDPSISAGYEERQERLRELIARCRRYGLKVYLYMNEPRAMPLAFFDKYPDLKGFVRGEFASMCTSVPAVQQYMRDSITALCTACPGLGGFFTISASENQTNCYSHATQESQTCPRCAARRREEVIAEINSIIADAAHDVDPSIKTIVWTWSWRHFGNEQRLRAIRLLSKNAILQCTAEETLAIEKAGIASEVSDYTMSNIPPSAQSLENWREAAASGHRTSAKVQLNTTWEGSTAPYIPVYENLIRYMKNLRDAGVENLQLSWTLGGYPSENLRIASVFFFDELCEGCEPLGYEDSLRAAYGSDADTVREAVKRFCAAFAEFPFNVGTLYNAPQNGGPSNLLFAKPTGLRSTMTCWTYDFLTGWRSIYPEDVFEDQFRKLADGWQSGLDLLSDMAPCEFRDIATICGALFRASYNQIRFVRRRDAYLASPTPELLAELREIITSERDIAVETYRIMLRQPSVGYEAANHYYFSRSMIEEKVVNCEYLLRQFAI